MDHTEITLEFDKIKQKLSQHAVSVTAERELLRMAPYLSLRECQNRIAETTEARQILDSAGSPPLSPMKDMEETLALCEKGSMLSAEQLEYLSVFITSCRRLKNYLKKAESQQVAVAGYGASICDLNALKEEIDLAIRSGAVISSASPTLRDLRRKIENQNGQMKAKLDELLRGKKSCFSEGAVSIRNGRYVLPVRKEYKNQVSGSVIDISGSGGTYFIEPTAVSKLQDGITTLKIEEDNEIRKILYTLTALVDDSLSALRLNMEAMTTLDMVFAKAKLSEEMGAVPATMDTERGITIKAGRHPLLRREECVPLDFALGGAVRGIIITGPNTGGKTVALKTVGLLATMAQCGLHVPAAQAQFCMNNLVLCDIGDGQSIAENLSTFSAHITNIIRILGLAGRDSLVLLDELGSGTDPAEGMGIAVSILEELRQKGCLFVCTTHYPEVKEYAAETEGLVNARMAFDRESLKPLYRLEQGEAGESCALYIAQRLGFPSHMLERAHQAAYGRLPHREGPEFYPAQGVAQVEAQTHQQSAPQLKQDKPIRKKMAAGAGFALGDSVLIGPEGELGLVFRPVDEKGMVGVQVKGTKRFVNHKRLTVKTPAAELYPPDYDFSIIFDSVEHRKANRQMERKFVPGLTIKIEEPER